MKRTYSLYEKEYNNLIGENLTIDSLNMFTETLAFDYFKELRR